MTSLFPTRQLCSVGLTVATLVATIAWTGCSSTAVVPGADTLPNARSVVRPHETLNGTAWMQLAAEYHAVVLQAYNVALEHLGEALTDSSWTAMDEGVPSGYSSLPPAIIVDVDETVLDGSSFQARLIRLDTVYVRSLWNAWVKERKARALPGSVEFLQAAADSGVAIFYVTNRVVELDSATYDNLVAEGFPVKSREHVLTRGKRPEWTGDKATRREFVAATHRVLFLAGDDLNDFVSAHDLSLSQRLDAVRRYHSFWGTRWIVLPNPDYGSWERAITRGATSRRREDLLRAKIDALRTD